jgi:ABC-type multidrug transport system permease subunit
LALVTLSGLFLGFIFFNAPLTHQGLQNQMRTYLKSPSALGMPLLTPLIVSIFLIFTIFGSLNQQIMPHFVVQRALYEVRERPSKTYSWQVFMASNIIVELPWNALAGVILFFCYYYPVGLYNNATPTDSVTERGGLFFLLVLSFLLFTSTFTNMMIAGMDSAETAGNLSNFLFSMCLVFNGVLASPSTFPRFWIFMYRVSPFTYLTGGLLSAGLMDQTTQCADNEYLTLQPGNGETCGSYMTPYIESNGGYVVNQGALQDCQYCTYNTTNYFLNTLSVDPANRWRDFGLIWVFIAFNVVAAVVFYWVFRVPKNEKEKKEKMA